MGGGGGGVRMELRLPVLCVATASSTLEGFDDPEWGLSFGVEELPLWSPDVTGVTFPGGRMGCFLAVCPL